MEHKTSEAFITGVEQDQGIIKAIFSVMGNIDLGNDRIHNGAFAKTFMERGHKVLVLDQHRTQSINDSIAKTLHLRELGREELPLELLQRYPDATGGAEITAQFSLEDENSKKAFFRLKNRWVNEWSFGYDAFDTSFTREERNGKQASIREIRTVKLYEVSPVLFGMNDATMTTGSKSTVDIERLKQAFDFWQDGNYEIDRLEGHDLIAKKDGTEFTVLYNDLGDKIEFEILGGESMDEKGASGKMDLPLAGRDMAWDNTAAIASIRRATGSSDEPSATYKNGFFWYDSANEDQFTAYKLPFAQEVDGSLKAMPRGIFAVANRIDGTNIPASDKEAVKARVARYYAKMRDEFDDDSIKVPWEKEAMPENEEGDKSGQEETEQKESVQEEPNQETDSKEEKAGRAISARNQECIRNTVTALQGAIDSLNGMLPVVEDEDEEEQPIEVMEVDDNLNTVTVAKMGDIVINIPEGFDIEKFKELIDKAVVQPEHEPEQEAGPDQDDSPTDDNNSSPFDFDKALQDFELMEKQFMEEK